MAKKKVAPPRWWELLETGDKITCVTPYGLVPNVYEAGDVARFIAREGGGLKIQNRGEAMIVPHEDFLPCTSEGMTEAELVMKIQLLDRAVLDLDELLRYLAQSSQPVKAQCAGCEGWFHSLIVGGDGVGRCVKCNQNQEAK